MARARRHKGKRTSKGGKPRTRRQSSPGALPKWAVKKLAKQAAERASAGERRLLREAVARAELARDKFKPTKRERGRIILVNTEGKRADSAKGRRGWLVYVTKTGRKRLVRPMRPNDRRNWRPRKLAESSVPLKANLKKAAASFQRRRLVKISGGRVIRQMRGTVKVRPNSMGDDFHQGTVEKLGQALAGVLGSQASHRSFVFRAKFLVATLDGRQEVVDVSVDIARQDHEAIRVAGLLNFVRMKLYAHFAQALGGLGLVTVGSSNHVRRLVANEDAEDDELVNSAGMPWAGTGLDLCQIEQIQWEAYRAK